MNIWPSRKKKRDPAGPAAAAAPPSARRTGRRRRADTSSKPPEPKAARRAAPAERARRPGFSPRRALPRITLPLLPAARFSLRVLSLRRLRGPGHAGTAVWPLLAGALLGLAGGAAYGLLTPAQYTAYGHVVLQSAEGQDPATTRGFAQVYGRVATDWGVLERAAEEAGVPVGGLRDRVRAAASPDAPVIEISGTAPAPGQAAAVTNAVVRALIGYGNEAADMTRAELSLLSAAHPPSAPATPAPVVCMAVGLCTGALLGGLVLLVRPAGRREPAPSGGPGGVAGDPGDVPAQPSGGRTETPAPARTGTAG